MTSVVTTTLLHSISKWGHKNNQKLIILVVLLAMLLSIGLQATNFHQTINSNIEGSPDTNKDETMVLNKTSTIKHEDFQLLFGFNNNQETTHNNKEIPITKMNFILRGALSGIEHKKYASAIIQTSNQDKLYELGDTLPGGAILNQVYADHIVIKRGNQLEKLYFPETARDSRAFQEFRTVEEERPESMEQRPGNHDYPDDMSLEQRMQELREKLQEASQEL
ncbi:type II secretion system protein N [Endozoicomonas sp.]|uniref:type II secretion system protein N n=1 Tax=Endozoicomonas sp. TaxID=1892382 RepID=UPI0028888449|nr:type II secretion system protein N [Endozoicomonas sp.]